jgi:hypothetical protein
MAKKTIRELDTITAEGISPLEDFFPLSKVGKDYKIAVAELGESLRKNILSLPENFDFDGKYLEKEMDINTIRVNLSEIANGSFYNLTDVSLGSSLSLEVRILIDESYADTDMVYLDSRFEFHNSTNLFFPLYLSTTGADAQINEDVYMRSLLVPQNSSTDNAQLEIKGWHIVKSGRLWKI